MDYNQIQENAETSAQATLLVWQRNNDQFLCLDILLTL